MDRALVTGGAGFIGSNIVGMLREEGVSVRVLDDFTTGYRENLEPFPDVEVLEGDIRDGTLVEEAVKGCDVIFHTAAAVGNLQSIEKPLRDSEINVLGTLHVLEAARMHGVRRIVYSSSAAIFGELKELPIREEHPIEPGSPYGVSKLAAEKLMLAYVTLHGLDAACLRYFNVYGVNQRYDAYGNVIPIFVHQLINGQELTIFDDGEQTRDFVNVEDVARANIQAARAGASGAFNIASGTSITINRLVELLADASGLEPAIRRAPPRPGDVRDSLADISAGRKAFGYAPQVKLREGLDRYLEWMRTTAAVPG